MIDSYQILMLNSRMFHHTDVYSHAELTLYAGLRHVGANVVMYPWTPRYNAPTQQPKHSAWDVQFWQTRGGYNGISQERHTYDELCRLRFDMVIATCRFAKYPEFLTQVKQHFPCPLVMLDVDDGGTAEWGEVAPDIKFRAEVPLDSEEDCFSLPQSIMYSPSMLMSQTKQVDIHAYFAKKHPANKREELVEQLEGVDGVRFSGIIRDGWGIPIEEYLAKLRQSKLKYGLRGNGYNSQHFWEGLAAEGVLLIADIEHKIPEPVPVPNAHYIQLDWDNVVEQAEYWLENDEQREVFAKESREFCYKWHTPKARAQYFLEACAGKVPSLQEKVWQLL